MSRRSSAEVDGQPGGRCGWVQCRTMRCRCQRNSVSGVTSHPARLRRGSAAAIAPSKVRSASVNSGRSTCRRSTPSWWRNTMISRSFERRERTARRTSATKQRYMMRYTRTQHRPASRQVNDHDRVSGTHRPVGAHNSVVGADQGFRAPSWDQESVRDSGHEDSASAPIAAGQRPRQSFRHPQALVDPRSLNLRNRAAHGLDPEPPQYQFVVLFHIVCLLMCVSCCTTSDA